MEEQNIGETLKLAYGLTDINYSKIPIEVLIKAKQLLLDYIGYTIFAYKKEKAAEIIVKTIKDLGLEGITESTVLGYGFKTSCLLAAFANGAMAHMSELDDTHPGSGSHPGDSVIAAALALGEKEKISGKELLLSIITGYETVCRIGESVMPTHYWRGFHPSATINTFGAAVTGGKIFKFNPEQMAGVLGLAGLQASGYFYYISEGIRMPKDFNTGRAALSGVLAALLIKNDFQGGQTILESEKGFCRLFSDPFSIRFKRISNRIGQQYKILEVAHKPYPSGRYIHPAIDATLNILEKYSICPDKIKEVNIRMFETAAPFVDISEPWLPKWDGYGPTYSTQFNVAVTLLEGRKGILSLLNREQVKEKINNSKIRELIKKIKVIPDADLDKGYPNGYPTIVEIKTIKKVYSERVDFPKGEPENPISQKELEEKFLNIARNAYGENIGIQIISIVNDIEELKDISGLMELFVK